MNTVDDFGIILSLIRDGENEAVEQIVKRCDLFRTCDFDRRTLLHYSVHFRNKVLAKFLLSGNCPVDFDDVDNISALKLAMMYHDAEMMKILFEARANPSRELYYFATEHKLASTVRRAFLEEMQKKYLTTEKFAANLVNIGCHTYQIIFLWDVHLIELMIAKGSSSNSAEPKRNFSCLHIAVSFVNVEMVKLLLEKNANVNATDIYGSSPIFYICHRYKDRNSERIEILQMLISAGASFSSCNFNGSFQMSSILWNGSKELVRVLFNWNIDFTAKDVIYGQSILHELTENRNLGVVDELEHQIHRFDLNVRDKFDRTPLMKAVINANPGMVQLLLKYNANPNAVEGLYGRSALYFAYAKSRRQNCEHDYYSCIELLLQYNADPQIIVNRNNEKVTIFDAALKANNRHRMKPVIAHLARLEALGTPITETTYFKINLYVNFKNYFERCRQLLRKEIVRPFTVLELLTGNKRKLAACFKNEKRMLKLERVSFKSRASLRYTDYSISLRKRLTKEIYDRRFKKIASQIVCKILPSYFPRLVIHKITSYFSHKDLSQLYEF